MPLTKPRYDVLLADETGDVEHRVEVVFGDQLRAELEAPRHGLARIGDAPQHAVAMWIWAALTRTHVIDQPFQEFKPRLLVVEPVRDVDGEPAQETVDPTTAPSASPSS